MILKFCPILLYHLSVYHFIFCIYLYISTYHLPINLIDKLSFKFSHPSYKRSFVYHQFIYLSIHAFIRYNRQKSMAIEKQGVYLPCERTVITVVSEVMMYKEKTRREHEDWGPVTQGPIYQKLWTYYYAHIWKIKIELPIFCVILREKISSKYDSSAFSVHLCFHILKLSFNYMELSPQFTLN